MCLVVSLLSSKIDISSWKNINYIFLPEDMSESKDKIISLLASLISDDTGDIDDMEGFELWIEEQKQRKELLKNISKIKKEIVKIKNTDKYSDKYYAIYFKTILDTEEGNLVSNYEWTLYGSEPYYKNFMSTSLGNLTCSAQDILKYFNEYDRVIMNGAEIIITNKDECDYIE